MYFCSCDLNLRDKHGRTALHIAVTVNDSYIVKLLITRGIDVSVKDDDGKTAEELSNEVVRIIGIKLRQHGYFVIMHFVATNVLLARNPQ